LVWASPRVKSVAVSFGIFTSGYPSGYWQSSVEVSRLVRFRRKLYLRQTYPRISLWILSSTWSLNGCLLCKGRCTFWHAYLRTSVRILASGWQVPRWIAYTGCCTSDTLTPRHPSGYRRVPLSLEWGLLARDAVPFDIFTSGYRHDIAERLLSLYAGGLHGTRHLWHTYPWISSGYS
jgi:hypothetical protein